MGKLSKSNIQPTINVTNLSFRDFLILKAILYYEESGQIKFTASDIRKKICNDYKIFNVLVSNNENNNDTLQTNPMEYISQNYFYNACNFYAELGYLEKTGNTPKEIRFSANPKIYELRNNFIEYLSRTLNLLYETRDCNNSTSTPSSIKLATKMRGMSSIQLLTLMDMIKDMINFRDEGIEISINKNLK